MTIEDIERAMERMRAERERVLERLRDPDARDRRPLRSGEPTPAMRLESLDRELGRLRRRKRRAEARRPHGAHSPAPSSEAAPSPSGTAFSAILDSVSRYEVRRAGLMPGIGALLDAADDAVASLRAGVASAGLSVVDWPLVARRPGGPRRSPRRPFHPSSPRTRTGCSSATRPRASARAPPPTPCASACRPASCSGSAATAVSPSSTRCGHSRSTKTRRAYAP